MKPSVQSGSLTGRVYKPAQLGPDRIEVMCGLLDQFFENVTLQQFTADLLEKEWVFVFEDEEEMEAENEHDRIRGFSTLMRLKLAVDGHPVVAFYSGDTIIHPDYWHEMELPRVWGRHVFGLADSIRAQDPNTKVYWFLISSGYKTYRFLPVFFEEFYPTCRKATPPAIQQTLNAVARHKFGDQYDSETGIICFPDSSPLRQGVAEVSERRLRNEDIAFFVDRNPGYAEGDQLACLVEIDRNNVTAAGRRMLDFSQD